MLKRWMADVLLASIGGISVIRVRLGLMFGTRLVLDA